MKRRILGIMLSLCMVLSLLPVSALAAEGENGSDSADTTWYTGHESDSSYTLSDAADLAGLAQLVNGGNTFSGKTIKLGDDIDLTGIEWQPIGGDSVYFAGEFDGNGKTISNLTNTQNVARKGLFGLVEKCYIHDLTLKDVKFSGTADDMRVGALAGNLQHNNVIVNVTVDGLDYALTDTNGLIGGLTGYAWNSYVKNCVVKNANIDVTATGSAIGTMIAYGRGVTEDCMTEDFPYDAQIAAEDMDDGAVLNYVGCEVEDATIDVSGSADVGGFFGADTYNHWRNFFKNCTVTGLNVTCAEGNGVYTVGGFMGGQYGGGSAEALTNCSVTGTITSAGTNAASIYGGFLGYVGGRPGGATGCAANVDITVAAGDVGGFVGETQQYFAHAYEFDSCEAKGDVSTQNGTAGGFIANIQHGGDGTALNVTVTGCTVSGDVNGTTASAIIGNIDDNKNGTATGGEVIAESNTVASDVTVNNQAVIGDNMYGGNTDLIPRPIEIGTVEELRNFADEVNNGNTYAGKTVQLTADITFGENDYWYSNDGTTVVDYRITKNFAGTFDGQGHTIYGLKFKNTVDNINPYMYLFNSISGTVKNLTLDGVTANIGGYDYFGFIAYRLTGTAANCHVKKVTVDVAVASNGNGYIASSGAMFGQIASATVTDCTATNVNITCAGNDTTDCVGGLIGHSSGTADERGTISNCSVTGFTVDAARKTKRLGGFIGYTNYTDVTDCTATDVTVEVDTYYQSIGGFVGNATNDSTFTKCNVVDFKLVGNTTDYAGDVGSFCGYTYSSIDNPVKFTNCTVTGLDMDLTCNDNNAWVAGGFIGYPNSNMDIDNCDVAGDITVTGTGADHSAGGFIGTLDWTSNKTINVKDSDVNVSIVTPGTAGGFVGEAAAVSNMVTFINTDNKTTNKDLPFIGGGEVSRGAYSTSNNRIQGAVMNANPTESVVLELYSGETKIATTTLINTDYFENAKTELTWSFCITGTSSSWNTVWEAGHPRADFKPDKVVLYIDGAKVAENTVTLHKDNFDMVGEEAVWSEIQGVKATPVVTDGFTKNDNGIVTIFGETNKADPIESLYIELYSGETYLGKTTLNDIDGIYDAETSVLTWHFMVKGTESDPYWTTTWEDGHPTVSAQPTKVVLYVDGLKVSEGDVKMNMPDDLNPVVWSDFFKVDITFALNDGTDTAGTVTTDGDGKITTFPTDPTRSGYTFKGWYTAATGGTKIGTDTVFTEDTTVYAQWDRIQTSNGGGGSSAYAITIADTENGEVTANHKNASKGTSVTLTVTPDEGYALDTLTATDAKGNSIKLTDKGDGKYTFTMPSGKVTVSATFTKTEQPTTGFVDVPADAYYADAVAWAVAEGVTTGTSATTFSPAISCTRGQMVTFLWRAAGSPAATGSNPFTDVKADAYYYDAVLWAVENGITKGTSATTFSPDVTVTRGQTVTFLYRAEGSPAVTGSAAFTDVAADAYYADAVQWAVTNGITNGMTATTFGPDSDCTRAQIVTFLYRDAQ